MVFHISVILMIIFLDADMNNEQDYTSTQRKLKCFWFSVPSKHSIIYLFHTSALKGIFTSKRYFYMFFKGYLLKNIFLTKKY